MEETSATNRTTGNTTDALIDPAFQLALTVEFYFKYAILAIGIFGTAANALVLYALTAQQARDAKKRAINFLIINQNLLDLVSCLLLVITVCIQMGNIYLTGALGYFLCTVFVNSTSTHCTVNGSIINLVVLTVERYLKVVHPFWSKKNLKRWMVYAGMAFAWIGGIATAAPVSFITSRLHNGFCIAYLESPVSHWTFAGCNVFILFVIPLAVFIYCYGRIVVVIRRQMRVMAGHNAEGSSQMNASQAQSKRVKWNVIKTMIIVSVAFIVCCFPVNMYVLLLASSAQKSNLSVGQYPTMFLVYLNVCMNPFIYTMKHEGVKEQLARLVSCRKPNDGDAPGSSSNRAGGTHQTGAGAVAQT